MKKKRGGEQEKETLSPKRTIESKEIEISPNKTSLSPRTTEHEVVTTLSTLSTSVKPKRKRQRKNPYILVLGKAP